jgi:hypothetical protein
MYQVFKVFKFFKSLIPGFDETPWTSRYRTHVFPDLPTPKDRDYSSDFAFEDKDGALGKLLGLESQRSERTFHIEVKTSRDIDNACTMTPAQIRTVFLPDLRAIVRRTDKVDAKILPCQRDPSKAYVIMKVEDAIDSRYVRITNIMENPC